MTRSRGRLRSRRDGQPNLARHTTRRPRVLGITRLAATAMNDSDLMRLDTRTLGISSTNAFHDPCASSRVPQCSDMPPHLGAHTLVFIPAKTRSHGSASRGSCGEQSLGLPRLKAVESGHSGRRGTFVQHSGWSKEMCTIYGWKGRLSRYSHTAVYVKYCTVPT